MIEKVVSSTPLSFRVNSFQRRDPFTLNKGVDNSLIQQTKTDTYRTLIEQSVLHDSLLHPILSGSSSATRTLFNSLTQQGNVSETTSLENYFATPPVSQTNNSSYDSLPIFNADATLFYYGAPKPEVFYYVPEKLWQAIVTTPGIESAAKVFEGVPALLELPRWEVETGVGMEPRFKRVEVDDSMMLSYDYPQVLTYTMHVMQRDGADNKEITILESLTENIRRVLNEPFTLSSRPSEAYYASRILVLFGVEELYAAYEKSVKDYVKWVKGTMQTDDQMRIFAIQQDLETEYSGLMRDTQYEPLLIKSLEERVQKRTTNYNYPPKHSTAIRKVISSHPAESEKMAESQEAVASAASTSSIHTKTAKESPAVEDDKTSSASIPDRPLTSKEKLVLYGSCDPDVIQRISGHPAGS